jgi:hypothetical protein
LLLGLGLLRGENPRRRHSPTNEMLVRHLIAGDGSVQISDPEQVDLLYEVLAVT